MKLDLPQCLTVSTHALTVLVFYYLHAFYIIYIFFFCDLIQDS